MPEPQTIDAKILGKLRKVWAMRGSSYAGERNAAELRAAEIVAKFGYELHHVEQLLATNGGPVTAAREGDRNRRRRSSSKRAAVIQRYGSEEAVLAWQPREKLLRQAVEHCCTFKTDRPGWIASINGWRGNLLEKPSRLATKLISMAYPLPRNITEARAEYDYWMSRNEDIRLIYAEHDDDLCHVGEEQLDLPAILRQDIVEELIATGLQAISAGEVLLRFRYMSELEHLDEIQQALLRDVEYLAAAEMRAVVQNGQDTEGVWRNTKQRRSAIEAMLSNVDTRLLADREIARRLGVSPQTVGNIRRRLNGTATRASHSRKFA
ncbi:MAG: hypothetical protein ACRYF2_12650 [Janthinobacterium lividum]